MEFAKKLNFSRNSALGNNLEPALTSARLVMQTILGAPFKWRWNRINTGFVTKAGVQDYTLSNWAGTKNFALNVFTVDTNGNSQQVTTAGTSGSSAPTWNTTLGANTTDGSVVWKNLGPVGDKVNSQFGFAWIETASVYDTSISKWMPLQPKLTLALDSVQGRPTHISAFYDDGSGDVTFRLMKTPDAAYPISLTLQNKCPQVTSVNQTWGPIPDEFSYIYTWGFLALMWMFGDDPRFAVANQKFMAHLLSTSEGLTETERNIFLANWSALTGVQVNTDMQGITARGV